MRAAPEPAPGSGPLGGFSPATRAWFSDAFAEPTPAQAGAWSAIRQRKDTLVIAPTGSGKTLAAFLAAIDEIGSHPSDAPGVRVLYVSPLKALAVDVQRNLRVPLAGIRRASERLGLPEPRVSIGLRTGDTSPDERRKLTRTPPDILITTPESLFLLLTSQARESLRNVDTVIIDEVHAVAATKRGAHLALSLERLEHLVRESNPARHVQRIGLSATARPASEIARFLRPGGDVEIVAPAARKDFDFRIVVPVEDMSAIGEADDDPRRSSIWPHVEEHVVDLIAAHSSTLVFANSRRLAERLTGRLNEIWAERTGGPTVLARAHHGSVSREQRESIEEDLKAGRLPAVVATSSLELGIDMGAVDLVIQVESPPSVAGGLQRVGRAGHQVGAVSEGVFFPKYRGDLLHTAVTVDRMRAGEIEELAIPAHPLDVLAQQIVAAVAMEDWRVDDLFDVVRRAAPYVPLPESAYRAVLDMLAGKYPGDEFAELRPRLVWDRDDDMLRARPGAQRLAVTSGGTIPDRGLYPVYLVGSTSRVGELDEEMVYESRVGETFALGASTWRIEEVTHDRVWVSPAPGVAAKVPFWHGDSVGRPFALGRAIGEFTRTITDQPTARLRLLETGLDHRAADNLLAYLAEQKSATGSVPDDRTIVIERFRDELGDWRIAIHTPFGARVHAPWALAIAARLEREHAVAPQVMHSDDGIVLRLPDTLDDAAARSVAELLMLDPEDVEREVTDAVGGSALFAGRFRECAARALLLPRRMPGKRSPLWQQRQRSAHLLSVAARYPDFPIVLEAVRECLQDVFDLPALTGLLTAIRDHRIRVVDVETDRPSPFAQSLLFGYVAAFLYDGDAPLAERRAAALVLDTDLLAELLGRSDLRELLDPDTIDAVAREVGRWHLAPRDAEDVADLLRILGPIDDDAADARGIDAEWLASLQDQRRAIRVLVAGREHWAAVEDAARLRDALGVVLPEGIATDHLSPVADPLGDMIARFARTHGPFTASDAAEAFGLGVAIVFAELERAAARDLVVSGGFTPGRSGTEWCHGDVLRLLRRRSIAALRSEAEPVAPETLAAFLPRWQGLDRPGSGSDALLRVIEQLAGVALPARQLEDLILPARVADYAAPMLDELLSAGEVTWWGAGSEGWVALAPVDLAPALLPAPDPSQRANPRATTSLSLVLASRGGEVVSRVYDVLRDRGALFFRDLSAALAETGDPVGDPDLLTALWDLAWAGQANTDTLSALRSRIGGKPAPGPRSGMRSRRRLGRPTGLPVRGGPPSAAGRWSLPPAAVADPTLRAIAAMEAMLDRDGIVTRAAVSATEFPGGFSRAYRVLDALEESGRCQRAYALEGLGAAQFALPGVVDRLRTLAAARHEPTGHHQGALTLAAADPAQPYGASLPWPATRPAVRPAKPPGLAGSASGHRPSRSAGALVTTVGSLPAFFLARGHRSLLTFDRPAPDSPETWRAAADSLVAALRLSGQRVGLHRLDGAPLGAADHPALAALAAAGFSETPSGWRLR